MSCQKISDVTSFSPNTHIAKRCVVSTRTDLEVDAGVTTQDARVAAVIRFLDQKARLRTHELAALVGLSKSRLRNLFKGEVGLSIGRFAMEVRLQAACKLLATSHRSLKEICGEVGITDPSNFIRHFKKRFRQTPSVPEGTG